MVMRTNITGSVRELVISASCFGDPRCETGEVTKSRQRICGLRWIENEDFGSFFVGLCFRLQGLFLWLLLLLEEDVVRVVRVLKVDFGSCN